MVDATYSAGHPEFGAGIIVSETVQRTVIVTAAHVIETQGGELASNIQVEFRSLRGRTFKASVTRSYIDLKLDLAVLFVERQVNSDLPQELDPTALQVVSPSKPQSLVGSSVQVIGAMGKKRWATVVNADKVVASDSDELRLVTDEAQAGASGGAVFDTLGRLLGICSRVDTSTGNLVILPMPAVLQRLERWGLPAGISYAQAGTSSPELNAQIQSQMRIDVLYQKPATYDPQQPLGASAPNFPHRIVAKLSPGIRQLTPTVDVSYVQASGQTKKYTLKAPDYSVDTGELPLKLDGEAWVTFPDGRRLGPIPTKFDFESGPIAAASALGAKAQEAGRFQA